ncbi:unnamed protein product, partial [Symbiodinium sp. KB8]
PRAGARARLELCHFLAKEEVENGRGQAYFGPAKARVHIDVPTFDAEDVDPAPVA